MKSVAAIFLCIALGSSVGTAKIKPNEFDQTATVKEVTSGREVTKVTESGRLRYGNQFVATTEIDNTYDLSGPRRIELGTYPAKFDKKGNRVQFLLLHKNGKPFSSI